VFPSRNFTCLQRHVPPGSLFSGFSPVSAIGNVVQHKILTPLQTHFPKCLGAICPNRKTSPGMTCFTAHEVAQRNPVMVGDFGIGRRRLCGALWHPRTIAVACIPLFATPALGGPLCVGWRTNTACFCVQVRWDILSHSNANPPPPPPPPPPLSFPLVLFYHF